MPEEPKARMVIDDFKGLITAADTRDVPNGAAVIQVNVVIQDTGELTIRGGYKQVIFEDR